MVVSSSLQVTVMTSIYIQWSLLIHGAMCMLVTCCSIIIRSSVCHPHPLVLVQGTQKPSVEDHSRVLEVSSCLAHPHITHSNDLWLKNRISSPQIAVIQGESLTVNACNYCHVKSGLHRGLKKIYEKNLCRYLRFEKWRVSELK